ncbi:hypothetical protein HanRHA438_Chr09g0398531 [Helianthus annuus]|uniref:Uncharacterized protein n=1 Tax=Helianthus annuus TaxID=4232 RepID=A0A9K3I654_HELAN|nr:hypothetical protein HanXRQr2_Chr09g0386891 [Helianthus annuus]KAJ0525942.1 hypothetical protein HanHA300_Chr09g0317681 [Helianthus annuus]KAJ0542338.1 hypothetical protein HanHA89_Chr09g0338661 [Helianthus annuus]KAJ0629433.1 hypothetical protein HanIR_Chr00c11g0907961 [Helianthus annuus]KAJ0707380.1 hypothetical protein HanLR1_Chr09g0317801 [Helianthus annuus]
MKQGFAFVEWGMCHVFIEHGEFGFLSASSGMGKVVNEEQNAHCIYYMFINRSTYEETFGY